MTQDMARLLADLKTEIESHAQTRQALHLNRLVFEHCRQAVVITDTDNIIRDVNAAYSEMTGFSRDEVIGKTPSIGKSGRHDQAFYRQMWDALTQHNYWEGELWDRRRNGEAYPKHLAIFRILDQDGRVANYLAIFEDLTERKAIESELERHMHYDSLTGLANKVLFLNRLEHEFSFANRRQTSVGLLLLNLDRFGRVNETLGYVAGDQLLQAVARRLTESIRKTDLIARQFNLDERSADTVSRYGGDEFTFILADLNAPENAAIGARRLTDVFSKPFAVAGQEVYLSGSMGIAVYPQNAMSLEGMMTCAGKALNNARQAGGNCFRFFSETMNARSLNRFQLESDMRKAIAANGFQIAYQPKIDLPSGAIAGVEALARWPRSAGEPVSPANFIPLAEETGLILPLGEWILETACRELQDINRWLGRELSLAVNISARQLQYGKLPELLDRVLRATGFPAHLLELEITESMMMKDVENVIGTMHAIRQRGVMMAIDDFGTGYSSLSYLKLFPIRTLKIDRSFVDDIESDPDDANICDVTVLLAHKLGMEVVAEGVETAGQLKYLLSIGCEKVQGYFISKPLPAAEIETFIRQHQSMDWLGTIDLWGNSDKR